MSRHADKVSAPVLTGAKLNCLKLACLLTFDFCVSNGLACIHDRTHLSEHVSLCHSGSLSKTTGTNPWKFVGVSSSFSKDIAVLYAIVTCHHLLRIAFCSIVGKISIFFVHGIFGVRTFYRKTGVLQEIGCEFNCKQFCREPRLLHRFVRPRIV